MRFIEWLQTEVYHGTDAIFDKFDKSKCGSRTDPGFFGVGTYFVDDIENAKRWGKYVVTARITLQNPLKVNGITDFVTKTGQQRIDPKLSKDEQKKAYAKEMRRITDLLIKNGYDGVEYVRENGVKQYVVFDPSNIEIKSHSGIMS